MPVLPRAVKHHIRSAGHRERPPADAIPSMASGRAERCSRCQCSYVRDGSLFGDDGDDQLHCDNFTDTGNPVFDSGAGNDICDGGAGTDTAVNCETLAGTRRAAQSFSSAMARRWHACRRAHPYRYDRPGVGPA
jgi:hypothetical protein